MWLQFDLKYIANESPNLSRLESWCTHIGLHMGEINILIMRTLSCVTGQVVQSTNLFSNVQCLLQKNRDNAETVLGNVSGMPDLLLAILVLLLRLLRRTIDVVSDLVFPIFWGKVLSPSSSPHHQPSCRPPHSPRSAAHCSKSLLLPLLTRLHEEKLPVTKSSLHSSKGSRR